LLDGACRLDRLLERAHELQFHSLAITDHGVLYGAIDFYQAARARGIKPILGCEVYVAPGSRFEKKTASGGRDAYHHLVLLAEDETGYRNLVRLVTAAHLEGYYYKPRIDKELLSQHRAGLMALSGCLKGEIAELIVRDQLESARQAIDWYRQVLGADRFYLELQNHGLPEQAKVNRQLLEWAPEFGLKVVATNDVHYVRQEHWRAHDCLICIGTQTTLDDTRRLRYAPGQFHLRSAEEMKALFAEVPEAIRNTEEVAQRCNVELRFKQLHYPTYEPPEGRTREGYLRELLVEGLQRRYGLSARFEEGRLAVDAVADPRRLPTYAAPEAGTDGGGERAAAAAAVRAVADRVELELGVIEKTGFVSYFLIVGDFVRHGRSRGITCVARGSAAGSIVTYLLEISNVDPLRYGLLFERFLNPERVNPPDIDIDFADDRRAEVIEYVRGRYGRDCVAQIITFGTMGAKSVIRDVGRVMGVSYADCDRLAKLVPSDLKMTLEKALKQAPDLQKACDENDTYRELIEVAFVLEDLTRNASVHAAGVVIGPEPLVQLLPLKQDEDGAIVTQYAMGPVGDLGLLKMDFLGLKTLTVIRNTCELVRRTQGVEIPIDHLPLDDPDTYDLLNKANTLGVFQLESGGMRDLCRKFQISSIEHITALIALYRPGPMDLIPEFIQRRNGELAIAYEHPLLEPICRETYGIMVYQEQVMQATQALAGYTLGGADLLRRAMGKKNVEEMAQQRAVFVEGCQKKNQIPEATAQRIFNLLERFAGYGFNKSHAAAYAVVAYQTAYLKANYPVEFFCAMMTNDMADTAKLGAYIAEARAFGIEVLGPDVNESGVHFAPAPPRPGAATPGRAIRFGLVAIKGLGEIAVQQILDARQAHGPFRSLADLCAHVDTRTVNRKVLEALIRSGACDALGASRAALWASIDATLARAASAAQDRTRGQTSLFGLLEGGDPQALSPIVAVEEWPESELLAAEKELLGFYVSGHPLAAWATVLEKYALATASSLAGLESGSMTRVGGLVTSAQPGISKKNGKPYLLAVLEDLTGAIPLVCLGEACEKFKPVLVPKRSLLVMGEVNTRDDRPKIFPQEMFPLEEAPKRLTEQVHLRLHTAHLDRERLEAARQLIEQHPGRCPLFLRLLRPDGQMVFLEAHSHFSVTPSAELQRAADAMFGEGTYYAKVDVRLPAKAPRRFERRAENGSGNGRQDRD